MMQRATGHEDPGHNGYIYIITPTSMVHGTSLKGGRKDFKNQRARKSVVKQFFLEMAA